MEIGGSPVGEGTAFFNHEGHEAHESFGEKMAFIAHVICWREERIWGLTEHGQSIFW